MLAAILPRSSGLRRIAELFSDEHCNNIRVIPKSFSRALLMTRVRSLAEAATLYKEDMRKD
jgi:hypothetical protein